ncbi:polysaccharide polymerase [Glaciimonas immobilis]|uniref:Putative polymerase n=1 Tax=Glaciimonas immobilis TaxID=728004 RepID=A0A840RY28_9BURK|nr:polysaccharide polymerase [Glaciimonas immobilis]MBB5202008.1 putative polymerase [Glaciimonas immobilis]
MHSLSTIRNFIFPRPVDLPVSDKSVVFWILTCALTYQAVLCALHTNVHAISMVGVGLTEGVIYLACLVVLIKHMRLEFLAVAGLVGAYLFLMAIFRNQLDPKGFRDVMIPILFYGLGRQIGSVKYADRLLKMMVLVVLFFAFFELFFVDGFSRIFNIFSYYVSQGGLAPGSNWAKGSVLGLNGMRPEGIGRTILPALIGNHRVSSVFLEPVSLGNFAVIVGAWGLSKRRDEIAEMLFFVVSAFTMIALSDSRYGMITVAALMLMRCIPFGNKYIWMMILPVLCVCTLLGTALFVNGIYSDNVLGRLYVSGKMLCNLDVGMIFGTEGYDINFGDMGYPSLLTRLGLVLCLFLWIAFWMLSMKDERGNRFRASVTLYMSLILCVSGTSLFALKTAGILWFLVGCLVDNQKEVMPHLPEKNSTLTPALTRI